MLDFVIVAFVAYNLAQLVIAGAVMGAVALWSWLQ